MVTAILYLMNSKSCSNRAIIIIKLEESRKGEISEPKGNVELQWSAIKQEILWITKEGGMDRVTSKGKCIKLWDIEITKVDEEARLEILEINPGKNCLSIEDS